MPFRSIRWPAVGRARFLVRNDSFRPNGRSRATSRSSRIDEKEQRHGERLSALPVRHDRAIREYSNSRHRHESKSAEYIGTFGLDEFDKSDATVDHSEVAGAGAAERAACLGRAARSGASFVESESFREASIGGIVLAQEMNGVHPGLAGVTPALLARRTPEFRIRSGMMPAHEASSDQQAEQN